MKILLPVRTLAFYIWPRWAILTAVLASLGLKAFGQTPAFAPVVIYDAGTNSAPASVVAADVNGDGKLDLLAANHYSNTIGVYLGTGAGSFGGLSLYNTGAGSFPISLAVADVNGDGQLDVLTASGGNPTASVLPGTGAGRFAGALSYSSGPNSYPHGIAVGDVNGDGKPDILTANSGSNTLGVLRSTTVLASRAVLPGASASFAPNPAHFITTLTTTGLPPEARHLEATLYTALGQAVRRLVLPVAAGAAQANVPTAGLPAGVYLLCLSAHDAQGAAFGALPTQRLQVE